MKLAALVAAFVSLFSADIGWARPHHPTRRASLRLQIGQASYYATRFFGRRTAYGQRLRPGELTAASRTLPLGARARVTNAANGRSVAVTVTDRGPFVKRRIMDVSSAAADRLGMKARGVALVRIQPLWLPE